jgi:hypothetical protein
MFQLLRQLGGAREWLKLHFESQSLDAIKTMDLVTEDYRADRSGRRDTRFREAACWFILEQEHRQAVHRNSEHIDG